MRTFEAGKIHAPAAHSLLKTVAHWILILEPFWLAFMLFAFWYPSPQRDAWMWLLVGIPLTMVARFILYQRLWTRFPLDVVFLIFIVMALLNMRFAPYTRGLIMLGRPLLGMALCLYFVDYARVHGKLDGLLIGTLLMGLLVAFLALTGSQWNSKSDQLLPIINLLPRFTQFPAAEGGFNANEIAGALAWLTPLLAGVALLPFDSPVVGTRYIVSLQRNFVFRNLWRWVSAITFLLLFAALFFGQSRFALGGTLLALALMTPLVMKSWRWRGLAWAGLIAVAVLEIMIMRNVFNPANLNQQVSRDEDSLSARFDIWNSALHIIHDYPLTGVGLNMFRDNRVRAVYPVPTFLQPVLPHTHDEFLQFGTDMGIPGLALFIALYGAAGWMLWRGYRSGVRSVQIIAASVAAGLLAHAFFGIGDAVTLWDRFAFLFWWLLALAAAQYILVCFPSSTPMPQRN